MMNRPEPSNCDSSSRLSGVRSWSIHAIFALSTSRLTAYPKIRSCSSGGKTSIDRMRGSRRAWMNSFRIILLSLWRMTFLSHLLPQPPDREKTNRDAVEHHQQQLEPERLHSQSFQKNSAGDVHVVARGHEQRDELNHARHVADRVYESGKKKRGQERDERPHLV